jgi:asparagine synthase (glutamine-hydrolysing)
MNGFAGILNPDGTPVDRNVLALLTRSMAFRGPDAQEAWREGAVGLGHAMLRTTREAATEHQPAAFDGRLRIAADARIDARAELVRELNAKSSPGRQVSLATPDAELILHSYDQWGEACVEHFLGDFSFAIWDAAKRRLFCARDHLGVKPLYYAQIGKALVFSNTLDTLRLYPGFSSELCDAAMADYLIFGINLHPTRTPYEQILKLPAAHTLSASADKIRLDRYWSFPIEEPLHYRSSQEYVEQFRELLYLSVQDRLRCDRASVSLSGGLDSPAVAAAAAEQMGPSDKLLGMTYGFNRLIPDPEPGYARMVADYLRIPNRLVVIDDYKPFERWESPGLHYPWPCNLIMAAPIFDFMDIIAKHGRVLLTGQGGDPGLVPSLQFYRGARVFDLLWGVGKYTLAHGRHPRIGFRVAWQRWRGIPPQKAPPYPCWMDPELELRMRLRDRWKELNEMPRSLHPFRPSSYHCLTSPHLPSFLEGFDASCTQLPVDVRHPLYDLRLQRFFLRLPVVPWCADKEIIRAGMRDHLPETILRRTKCSVQGDPLEAILRDVDADVLNHFEAAPELERYVVRQRIPVFGSDLDVSGLDAHLRPINFNYWLSHSFQPCLSETRS